MPYLEPDDVLREFSRYALREVRPALKEDEQFMRGQVGSMASTLRFLADELEGIDDAVDRQHRSLAAALTAAEGEVDDPQVADAIVAARERVEDADVHDARGTELVLLDAADDALAAIDELEADVARRARDPIYEFLDTRLEAQLGLLGRQTDDG